MYLVSDEVTTVSRVMNLISNFNDINYLSVFISCPIVIERSLILDPNSINM